MACLLLRDYCILFWRIPILPLSWLTNRRTDPQSDRQTDIIVVIILQNYPVNDSSRVEVLYPTQHLVEQIGQPLMVQVHVDNLTQTGIHQLHHQIPGDRITSHQDNSGHNKHLTQAETESTQKLTGPENPPKISEV